MKQIKLNKEQTNILLHQYYIDDLTKRAKEIVSLYEKTGGYPYELFTLLASYSIDKFCIDLTMDDHSIVMENLRK